MEKFERWTRQIPLFKNNIEDQERLLKSRITVVGAGGLGSAALYYLAAAGAGNLQIVEPEKVETSNLNRQIIYDEESIGKLKAELAEEKLKRFNHKISIYTVLKKAQDSFSEIKDFNPDLIIDCSDNLETRFYLNEIAHSLHVPLVYAMVEGLKGMVSCVYPYESACFNCVFEGKSSSTRVPPVLGVTPGIAGTIEAAVAIFIVLGQKPLFNRMLSFDLSDFSFHNIDLNRRKGCHVCNG